MLTKIMRARAHPKKRGEINAQPEKNKIDNDVIVDKKVPNCV
jgi:hypothetical protein